MYLDSNYDEILRWTRDAIKRSYVIFVGHKMPTKKTVFIEESWVLKFHRTFLGQLNQTKKDAILIFFWYLKKKPKKICTNFVEIEKLLIGLSLKYFSWMFKVTFLSRPMPGELDLHVYVV